MKTIYLAHPFLIKDKIREWQLKVELKNKNITFINPFVNGTERKIEIEHKLKDAVYNYEDCEYLVNYDLSCINKSDITLAIIDGSTSYGTIMELYYSFNKNKPTYIICTNGYENHPWLTVFSDKIFITFKEAEEWLKTL